MEQQTKGIINQNDYLAQAEQSTKNYYVNRGFDIIREIEQEERQNNQNTPNNTNQQTFRNPFEQDKSPEIQFATKVDDESVPFRTFKEIGDFVGKTVTKENVKKAGKDVVKGVLEIPRATANALNKAMSEALDLGYQSIKGLNEYGAQTIDFPANLSASLATGEDIKVSDLKSWIQTNFPEEVEIPQLLDDPKSTTGNLLQNALTFLAGFAGAGKLAPVKAIKGKFTQDMLKGAISDMAVFDGQEERLSNFIESFPALKNPITNFLQAKETDSELEGKLKNVFEGAGLGFITGAVFKGIKAIAQSRAVKNTLEKLTKDKEIVRAKTEIQEAKTVEEMQKDFSALGDINKKVLVSYGKAKKVSPDEIIKESPKTKDDIFINFARIETYDDVKKVMQEMANKEKKSINKARRGKQTFKNIEENADQENAWQILLDRRQGQPLNAEQTVALRKLWTATSEKLVDMADLASKAPTPENLLMFRKMVSIQNMVQREIISARTETARALSSWRIPTGGSIEMNQQILKVIAENGGEKQLTQFANAISKMAKDGDYTAVAKMVEDSSKPNFIDMFLEYRTSALLTSFKTHIVNVAGNILTLTGDIADKFVAEQFGRINSWLGMERGTVIGEAMAEFRGMIGAIGDALILAKKNWQTGTSAYTGTKAELSGKQLGAIRSGATIFGYEIKADTLFGKAVDMIGNLTRIPYRALSTSDEFFKTVAYRGEVRAQAYRQVMQEVEAKTLTKDKIGERFQELLDNPPENIRIEGQGKAQYLTFTNTPNQLAQGLQKITNNYPLLKIVIPFIRTPANIFDMALQHTPLAPLYKSFRADVMAGGARQELALAKMATGSCVMLAVGDLALNGVITGGGPRNYKHRRALEATGWQPYSVKIGDKYYSYSRLDPISTVLGLMADFIEISTNVYNEEDINDEDSLSIGSCVLFSVANNLLSKNYVYGLAQFMENIQGGPRTERYIKDTLGSLVPNLSRDIRNLADPYQREVFDMIDNYKNRIVGFSKDLPVKRDMFGREMSVVSGIGPAYDFLVPVRVNNKDAEPIDFEIVKQEVWIEMPRKTLSYGGDIKIDLSDRLDIYSRYVELAGNEAKINGKGCKDYLNEFIKSDIYNRLSDGADGSKNQAIRNTINRYRNYARKKLLEEYPQLKDEIDEQIELLRNQQ